MRGLRFLLLLAVLLPSPCWAVQPDEILADPALEARARALSRDLRCMVCQNQSIDDSEAPLARDLRLLVRERLQAGDGDNQVIDYLVKRYGDFVLLKPRFSAHTALLWLGPASVLVGGAAALLWSARRRRGAGGSAAPADRLSAAEQARLARLMSSGEN
jgi:cytochrome c-type biogenesis protein CcmH